MMFPFTFLLRHGFFILVVAIVAMVLWHKSRQQELQFHQDLRLREMEHQRKMKELELELEKEKNRGSAGHAA